MGRGHRKHSLAETGEGARSEAPNVGLGSTLAHLRDSHSVYGLTADGPNTCEKENLHKSPEWTVVNGISRKRKRDPQDKPESLRPEKELSKKKDNRPALTYSELHKMQASLKISDLQNLVIYCLADGTSPQWISVKHHKQIRKAVVLLVPGLEKGMFSGEVNLLHVKPGDHVENLSASGKPRTESASENTNGAVPTSSGKSPDDFMPLRLVIDKMPTPLKPLGEIFSHVWPVKAPGDEKYNKVHSPLHAMLAAPVPKSQEDKNRGANLKGPKRAREVGSWENERTPITAFVSSVEDLRENEYAIHPACFSSEEEREQNLKKRRKENQLQENGWVDTEVTEPDDALVPDSELQSGSITAGRTVFALDCEMCIVEGGESALTRISIVDWDGEVVMDELVMPDKPVTDYLTQYSGMTAARLAATSTTLSEIQHRLLPLLTPRSIIIGHSLNSDLSALKITHPFIIDTSLLFPHPRGPPLKSSLKYLAQKYIGREIQKNHGATGHDSIEDARACLDLVKQKCEKGLKWGTSEATNESIFKRLARANRPGITKEMGSHRIGAIIDRASAVRSFAGVADVCIPCENDDEVVEGVKRAVTGDGRVAVIPGGGVDFTWARLHGLEKLRRWSNDHNHGSPEADDPADDTETATTKEPSVEALSATVTQTVQNIMSIYTDLPPCTLFIVYSGTGDRREVAKLQRMHRQFKNEFATKKWDELSVQWTDVEEQALRRACINARQGVGFIAVT